MTTLSEQHKDHLDDVKLQKVVQLHLIDGLPQAKVADLLKTNQSEISRLLRRAREQNRIRLTVLTPTDSDADVLKHHFKLRDVVIVPPGSNPTVALDELGFGVANYLVERDVGQTKIGISCGNTTRMVARAFSTRFQDSDRLPRYCEVYSLNAVSEDLHEVRIGSHAPPNSIVASTIHPATIVGAMLAALPDASGTSYVLTETTARDVRGELKKLNYLDHYIVGIGAIDFEGKKRAAAASGKSHEFNALMWAQGAAGDLKDAVGECLYQPYTRDHVELFARASLPDGLRSLHEVVASLPLSVLREAVCGKANVIAVAGGQHKVAAIYTALEMGLCNVLVTDSACAAAMVEMKNNQHSTVQTVND
jgi:DNA-binding transcriptional regulator LsrR (DeoR family)